MLKTSDEIKSQLSPNLQKLMNDVLAKSDGSRPLYFADEQEHKRTFGKPFPLGVNGRFLSSNKQFVIFLRQLSVITNKEELDIAHELGHLWLLLCNYPENRTTRNDIQDGNCTIFGELHDYMAHAIFYPYLNKQYKINLYKRGNNRLTDFIKDQLPGMKNTSQEEKLFLILNYIMYVVTSDDLCLQDILHKAYSKKASNNLKFIEDSLLPIIHKLMNEPNPQNFKEKYRAVLEVLETNFDIP